ncbi:MAG: SMC family ATPase [Gemmatimonadaceae bacterium]|nr:SMC family ATPase [Gemmatimonadaceae bacterium]
MRLVRLRLVNFRQHADSDIAFETGLTGIIGPNGAGKSTILEAIAWALYGGNTLRGGNESIRFRRAAARAPVRVELEFELAGHRYRVVRGLSMAELYLDGGTEPIANSVTAVTDMLQRRIGMTRTEFFNTYFTGQKDLAVMNALTAGERAQFLSRVLGYERLRVAQELCATRRKELASEIAGLRAGMPERDAVEAQLRETDAARTAAERAAAEADRLEAETKAALAAVAPRWLAAQTGREERQRLETELAAVEGEAAALTRAEERLVSELAQVAEARAALQPLLPDVAAFEGAQAELEAMRALEVHDGRRRALLETQGALAAEVQALDEQRDRLATAPQLEEQATVELEARRKALEEAHGTLEARRTEWVRDRQEVDSRLRALRGQYAEMRDQRDKLLQLGEEGACPTCTRPLGAHFRDVLDVLERQLELVESDGSYFRSRLEQLEPMPADIAHLDELRRKLQGEVGPLERRLAKVQAAVQQLALVERDRQGKAARLAATTAELATIPGGYDAGRHQALEAEHARLAEVSTLANRLSTRIEREPVLKREQEALARTRAALAARRDAASARLAALQFPEEDFAALRRLHDEVAAAYAEASRAAAGARAGRDIARDGARRAADAKAEHDRLAERVEALEQDRRLHDELHRAYSDLRTDLNFQLRPEVSEIASSFITELTDARYTELELDDKYRLVVLEEGVPQTVISGGEEDIANLVLRLAISQMIADRAGQSFSLLVLDEVFGSLDEVRRQNVLTLLRGLHDRFEQVIVITHIEGVRDGLDRVITVGFDERTGGAVVGTVEPAGGDTLLLEAGSAA